MSRPLHTPRAFTPTYTANASVSPDMFRWIRSEADRRRVTRSELVRAALRFYRSAVSKGEAS